MKRCAAYGGAEAAMFGEGMAVSRCNGSSSSCSRSSSASYSTEDEEEEDGLLECPVCWEGFNSSSRVPYILWCGHSLCKSCLLSLEWATLELPVAAVQLPLLIACPWCQCLSCRLLWPSAAKVIKYPRPNYFVLWLLESAVPGAAPIRRHHRHRHAAIIKTPPSEDPSDDYQLLQYPADHGAPTASQYHLGSWEPPSQSEVLFLKRWFRKLNAGSFVAKALLLLLLISIVFWVLPFCALVLMLHVVATLIFAFPAFLVVYFAFPCLSWLSREIVTA